MEIISNSSGINREVAKAKEDLCRAIRRGIRKQLENDQVEVRMISSMMIEGLDVPDHMCRKWDKYQRENEEEAMKVERRMIAAMDEKWNDQKRYPDHVNGGYLDPEKVRKARQEEMEYVRRYKIYEKVSRDASRGKKIIKTRWVDTDKGAGTGTENYRCRLVAMEVNRSPNVEYFSATPPLEVMKLIMSWVASQGEYGKGRTGLMYIDVRRAYFNAAVKREVYIEIPHEDREEGDENRCGRLRASLYGTRDAAANWAEEYTKTMVEMGFDKGKASPCIFVHRKRGLKVMVHGDDFLAGGDVESLEWMRSEIQKKYEVKSGIISGREEDGKEMSVLNRTIRWENEGLSYEPDRRHAAEIVRGLGLEGSKEIGTPAEASEVPKENGVKMNGAKATAYRSIAARCNYLALDRIDIQYATKQCCKSMANPMEGDWAKLRRLGRYIKSRPSCISYFRWQEKQNEMSVFADSDWAGDRADRKSTSGGMIMMGNHLIKAWSKDQENIALSSGEAELYAACLVGVQGKGIKSFAKDMDIELKIHMYVDASAAIGVIQRQGLGKLRHVEVRDLWLQDEVRQKRIKISKIDGKLNPADLGTKALAKAEIDRCVKSAGCYFENEAEMMYVIVCGLLS